MGVIAALAVLLALVAVATWQLQRELERRSEAAFDCRAVLEPVPWEADVNGQRYKFHANAWVEVRNDGPTSTFSARVIEISGVPSSWGEDYKVVQPMWETNTSSEIRIAGRGGIRRLSLAAVLGAPRAFWFNTVVVEGQGGAGHQWQLGAQEAADVAFVLEVVNTGDADQVVRKRGHITVPVDHTRATFELAEAS